MALKMCLSIYNVLKTVTRELEMTNPFIGVGRFVWTQEGNVCVTPEELTVHSGGDVRGEVGLLVGQTASWGDGGEVLPCSEGEHIFAVISLLYFLITGEVKNWTEVKSKSSWRSAAETKVVKGTQKAEQWLSQGEAYALSTPATCRQARLSLPGPVPWLCITNKVPLGLMSPCFAPAAP